MREAHEPDCEATAADCRFIIRSENEAEAIELPKKHMKDVRHRDYTDEELRRDHLRVV